MMPNAHMSKLIILSCAWLCDRSLGLLPDSNSGCLSLSNQGLRKFKPGRLVADRRTVFHWICKNFQSSGNVSGNSRVSNRVSRKHVLLARTWLIYFQSFSSCVGAKNVGCRCFSSGLHVLLISASSSPIKLSLPLPLPQPHQARHGA